MAANHSRTIVVTGATGKQGGAAFHHLKQKGFTVRALVRNPERPEVRALEGSGVEVFQGDFDDPASMERALDGADGAYSVQAWQGGPETEIRQGIAFAEAANRQEIGHFVYSSVGAADQNTGIPHFESKGKIEERIRQTGMPYTIFRPVFFMENWQMMREGIDYGAIMLPLSPQTRLQMVAVDDIGAFVALAFEHPGHWHNRAFELAGDELSMAELAEAFTRTSGREVRYQQVPWDQFEQQAGHELTVMYRWFEEKGYEVDIAAVRQHYPQLTSFNHWLKHNWSRGMRGGNVIRPEIRGAADCRANGGARYRSDIGSFHLDSGRATDHTSVSQSGTTRAARVGAHQWTKNGQSPRLAGSAVDRMAERSEIFSGDGCLWMDVQLFDSQ
jgi:uncharacterized protein YbjT (DUF2867 family)